MRAQVDFLTDALIAPLTRYAPPGDGLGQLNGGVYQANGVFNPHGTNLIGSHENVVDPMPDRDAAERLSGRYLYMGLMQNAHFGHLVSECLTRLWAADQVLGLDGLVFFPRYPEDGIDPSINAVMDFLLPDLPRIRTDAPTVVEELILPQPLRFPAGFLSGHPQNRAFFAARLDPEWDWRPEKVFVSRARLARAGAKFILEEHLDACFRVEGYTVVHPETLSPKQQLNLYAHAKELVFSEGSAFHFYATVSRPDQRVYFIWRRKVMHDVFAKQLASFGGPEFVGSNHVVEVLERRDAPGVMARAQALVNFETLGAELSKLGFVTGDHWALPPEGAVKRALKEAEEFFVVPENLQ